MNSTDSTSTFESPPKSGQVQIAFPLHGLAIIYMEQGKYTEAARLFQRTLSIREQVLESHHPDIASTLHHFAALRALQGNQEEAISLYQHALSIQEKVYGLQHSQTTKTREQLRAVQAGLGHTEEAAQLSIEQQGAAETDIVNLLVKMKDIDEL